MNDFQKYKSAKQNILDYINDRDKFNRVYYLISENIEILDNIVNKTYKNFDYVDKALVQTFVQHLKGVMETANEVSETDLKPN